MKLTCVKQELIDVLRYAIKAVPNNDNVPILSGVHVRASSDGLELWTTNNDLYIVSRLKASVDEPGAATVSAKYLYEHVRNFPGANIEMKMDGKSMVRLSADEAVCELLTFSEDFPEPDNVSAEDCLYIEAKLLKKLILESAFAVATAANVEAQTIFTGVLIDISGGSINLVGTNTHRLALSTSLFEAKDAKCIVPAKALAEIGRNLPDTDDIVSVSICKQKAVFGFGGYTVYTSVLNGNFPDYHRVIPKDLPITVTVNKALLAQTVSRASIIADAVGTTTSPVVKFDIAADKITISSVHQSVGRFEERIDAETADGEISISFNPAYILDALKAIDGDNVNILLNAPLKPALLVDPANERYQCVLTPIRTKA